jgi:hypothetical protein
VVGEAAGGGGGVGLLVGIEALDGAAQVEGEGVLDAVDDHFHGLRGSGAFEGDEETELAPGAGAVGVVRAVVEGVVGGGGHLQEVLRPVPTPGAYPDMGEGSGEHVVAMGARAQPLEHGGVEFLCGIAGSHGDVLAHALLKGGGREGGRVGELHR